MKRAVYMISDGTGITVESLTTSLLSQFETIDFEKKMFPFVDSMEKIEPICKQIISYEKNHGSKPLVFMTLVNPDISACVKQTKACVFDLFDTFVSPMAIELGTKPSDTVGRAHAVSDDERYSQRIDAVNYALAYDDGMKTRGYEKADIILIGVSRCGKTPSCLYMALQFGLFAANYPLTDLDLSSHRLPSNLQPYREKIFGLTIDPDRLQSIRNQRRPNSLYSSVDQCRREVHDVVFMYQQEKIPYINSTHFSIEEIATKIMAIAALERRI